MAMLAQHLGDHLWVHVLREQERGARVPEVVKPYLRQPSPLEQGLEAMRGNVAAVQRLPSFRREYETVLAPQTARSISPNW
jgi:hypothetical protein